MTVATDAAQPPRDEYLEDGATLVHAINFEFVNDSEISVSRILVDHTEILLVNPTHYTVAGGGGGATGSITKVNGGVAGATIRIDRNTPRDQLLDYQPGDDFPAEDHEGGLDKLTRIVQELARDLLSREDVRDLIGALLVAGAGISITVDDAGNKITIASSIDAEFIQDAMASALVAGAGITIGYDDVLGKITITADALDALPDCLELSGDQQTNTGGGAGGGGAALTGEQIQDLIAAMVVEGAGIDVVYDDAAGTLTITNTIGAGYTDEQVRDVMGVALAAGSRISIAVDDAGNTITISSDALAPSYRGLAVVAKAAAFDFDDTHGGKSIRYTGGAAAATLRLQANVALTDGWGTLIRNVGAAPLTIALEGAVHAYVNGSTLSSGASIAVGGVAAINRWAADEFTIVGPGVTAA
jgi:hypothetical protein